MCGAVHTGRYVQANCYYHTARSYAQTKSSCPSKEFKYSYQLSEAIHRQIVVIILHAS